MTKFRRMNVSAMTPPGNERNLLGQSYAAKANMF